MTQILNDDAPSYRISAIVRAVQFRPGMEDGWVSRNVGEKGQAYIETSHGRHFLSLGNKGEDLPYLVEWDNGYFEVVSASRFNHWFQEVPLTSIEELADMELDDEVEEIVEAIEEYNQLTQGEVDEEISSNLNIDDSSMCASGDSGELQPDSGSESEPEAGSSPSTGTSTGSDSASDEQKQD